MPGSETEVFSQLSGGEPKAWHASDWVAAATGIGSADATPTNPDSLAATRAILTDRKGLARYVALRLAYDGDHSAITTPPTVRVYGRKGPTGGWEYLRNVNGAVDVVLTPDITGDVRPGGAGLRYSGSSAADVTFDLRGNTDIMVAVVTAMAATGGAVANNTIQARFIPEV